LAGELGIALEVRLLGSFSHDQHLTISTIPAEALDTLSHLTQSGWLLNVNYSSKDSSFSKQFNADKVVQGQTMLIWQAIAQIRIFLNGTPHDELDNEKALFAKMAEAL
jgi:shikimate dehydrogenase